MLALNDDFAARLPPQDATSARARALVSVRSHERVSLLLHQVAQWLQAPTGYVVVDAIAKNAVGKIDKTSIRSAHAAGRTQI